MKHLLLGLEIKNKLVVIFLLLSTMTVINAQNTSDSKFNLLIGTYTQPGKSEGIYVYEFNSETGNFAYKAKVVGIHNPSFLTVSADNKYVYAVNELGNGGGAVSAFSFDAASGRLKYLNSSSSGGDGPCYVAVDKVNKFVFVGNYGGGSLAAVPLKKDGSLGASIQSIRHNELNKMSSGKKSHVHATVLSATGDFLYVPDLGMDRIYIYEVDSGNANPLKAANPQYLEVTAGSGPRHYTFHPSNKFAYAIQELNGMVTGFDYDKGQLNPMQTVSLPSGNATGSPDAADIHISPDGLFLYGSLRGTINELVIYRIKEDGMLQYAGRQSTLGVGPRNFAIDPTGNFLLVGNSGSDEIVIFRRNLTTGLLSPTGKTIKIASAVCLKFVPVK